MLLVLDVSSGGFFFTCTTILSVVSDQYSIAIPFLPLTFSPFPPDWTFQCSRSIILTASSTTRYMQHSHYGSASQSSAFTQSKKSTTNLSLLSFTSCGRSSECFPQKHKSTESLDDSSAHLLVLTSRPIHWCSRPEMWLSRRKLVQTQQTSEAWGCDVTPLAWNLDTECSCNQSSRFPDLYYVYICCFASHSEQVKKGRREVMNYNSELVRLHVLIADLSCLNKRTIIGG